MRTITSRRWPCASSRQSPVLSSLAYFFSAVIWAVVRVPCLHRTLQGAAGHYNRRAGPVETPARCRNQARAGRSGGLQSIGRPESDRMMTTAKPDRTLAAAGLILVYAMVIGFTDNFVAVIAGEAGLWQFHFSRTVMAMVLLLALVPVMGLRLRPRSWRAVVARSAIHGIGILIYFGALAFLPVAIVAAGLFTAPIFVLLTSWRAYGLHIGPFRIASVALGFLGVILVLGPLALSGASLAAVLPVAAGLMYAMGNIAIRRWCAG